MNKVIIRDLELWLHLGINEDELRLRRKVLLDIDIATDFSDCLRTDELADTIDYTPVMQEIVGLFENRKPQLIETVASEIAMYVLRHPRAVEVTVILKKPSASLLAKFGGCVVSRTK